MATTPWAASGTDANSYLNSTSGATNSSSYSFNRQSKPTDGFGDGSVGGFLGSDAFGATLNLGSTILGYMGMREQNKIAKDTLAFNKDVFNKQWASYQEDRARKIKWQEDTGDQWDRVNQEGAYAVQPMNRASIETKSKPNEAAPKE